MKKMKLLIISLLGCVLLWVSCASFGTNDDNNNGNNGGEGNNTISYDSLVVGKWAGELGGLGGGFDGFKIYAHLEKGKKFTLSSTEYKDSTDSLMVILGDWSLDENKEYVKLDAKTLFKEEGDDLQKDDDFKGKEVNLKIALSEDYEQWVVKMSDLMPLATEFGIDTTEFDPTILSALKKLPLTLHRMTE